MKVMPKGENKSCHEALCEDQNWNRQDCRGFSIDMNKGFKVNSASINGQNMVDERLAQDANIPAYLMDPSHDRNRGAPFSHDTRLSATHMFMRGGGDASSYKPGQAQRGPRPSSGLSAVPEW